MRTYRYIGILLLIISGVCHSNAQWISPAQYQEVLGQGIDVDWWSEGTDYSSCDWDQAVCDFNDAGIRHIRITLHNDIMRPEDFIILDRQINACIRYGISPIIAYRPTFMFSGTPVAYRRHLTDWWRSMALHYRSHSARLSFDLLFEPDQTMFSSYEDLNVFYEDCVAAIRVSNPHRILFIAPSYNSNPMYLKYLRIPSRHNGYLMAEWHFFARGEYNRAWNSWKNDRAAQSRWIDERIQAAVAWQRATGIYTWVGGWMPASYFDGGMSSIGDAYTAFLCEALAVAHIPFAVHGIARYYDYANRSWMMYDHAPMRTIFPNGNFAHSGRPAAAPAPAPRGGGFSIGDRSFARGGNPASGAPRNNEPNYRYDNGGFRINNVSHSQGSSYAGSNREGFARNNNQNVDNRNEPVRQQPSNSQYNNARRNGGFTTDNSVSSSSQEVRKQAPKSNGGFSQSREQSSSSRPSFNSSNQSRPSTMQNRNESRPQQSTPAMQNRSTNQNTSSNIPSQPRRGGGGVKR